MIFSIGTDIVNVRRIEQSVSRHGERFVNRILNPTEVVQWNQRKRDLSFLAKRFAAKEAISKALGTGIGRGVSFQNIVISNDSNGVPLVSVSKDALKALEATGASRVLLSISDEKEYAIAFAALAE